MQFYDPVSKIIKPDLNADVEAWLAQGNQITELPFGHTHFKDGNIPQAKAPVKPLDIEKYNAERVTKQKPVKSTKQEKPTKVKTVKPRVYKPKAVKQKRATKLVVYSERAMIRFHNLIVFKLARAENLNQVEALCIQHGYTTYRFLKDRPRCLKCIKNFQIKDYAEYKRQKLNQELMLVAASTKQRKFNGMCKVHGETAFLIAKSKTSVSGLNYKCFRCNAANQLKYKKNKGACA